MQKGTIFAGFSPAGAKTGSPLPEKSPTLILKSRRVLLYQSVPQILFPMLYVILTLISVVAFVIIFR
jgi:hypothetical protein